MAITISPNMSLPVPVVGQENGPQYAIDVDACLAIIDQHNHTPGQGVQIPPGGLNINANLPFNNNNAIELQSVRFQAQNPVLAPTGVNLGCVFEGPIGSGANGDLYYNDGVGNQIQITSGGHVNSGAGSISGLVSPASASYNSVSKTFVWQSDVNTPANLDAASIILRNLVANSPGLTLSPPTLGGDYTITLPTLPVSTLPVSISNTGVMSAAQITTSQVVPALTQIVPTNQTFTSGSGTYTPTSGSKGTPLYIRVRLIGGGGGGGGFAPNSGGGPSSAGSNGGTTTFGSIITATGGTGGGGGNGFGTGRAGGAGGSGSYSAGFGAAGIGGGGGQGQGYGGIIQSSGGTGGSSYLGGGAPGPASQNNGPSAAANSGGGGAGGAGVNGDAGGGGGAGGYVDIIIPSPLASSYTYAVGAGGGGGANGGSYGNGGVGGSGIIIVDEYYQ